MMRKSEPGMGIGEDSGIEHRDRLVVTAVEHQQGPVSEQLRGLHGSHGLDLRSPPVEPLGEFRIAHDADLTGPDQELARVAGPVLEVGRRGHGGHAPHPLVAAGHDDRQRGPGSEADQPDAGARHLCRQEVDCSGQIASPAVEREVARGPATPLDA